jgi:pseudouridine-5'-monophosphatase
MKLRRSVTHVIYDLDGVLLDTEPFYTQVTQEIVGDYGKRFDWSIKSNMIGRPSYESACYLVETLELPITPEEYLSRRAARLEELFRKSPPKPGVERFTHALHERGVPQAVATSSEHHLFALKTECHRAWFSIFAAAVVGDDPRVKRGKPAPDIFLVAAGEMDAEPSTCVVFEDSPAGVEAAHAAGMQVVAVPDAAMDRERYARVELVISDFNEIDPRDLGFD